PKTWRIAAQLTSARGRPDPLAGAAKKRAPAVRFGLAAPNGFQTRTGAGARARRAGKRGPAVSGSASRNGNRGGLPPSRVRRGGGSAGRFAFLQGSGGAAGRAGVRPAAARISGFCFPFEQAQSIL